MLMSLQWAKQPEITLTETLGLHCYYQSTTLVVDDRLFPPLANQSVADG